MNLVEHLGTALLGGLILNGMPCVLPVLTMKVFHVVETARDDPGRRRRHALAYLAGVVAAFVAFAGIVIALRAAGGAVGWGMQFQSPSFVAALTGLMLLLGLSSLGFFEVGASLRAASGDGLWATAWNGVVAAVMATPCSAPFLGSAAAFALAGGTSPGVTLGMFTAIGVGLAAPFVAIGFVPALARLLPRPGPWMETFKHLMGFTLLGASVWLFGVLLHQVDPASAVRFLGFALLCALALWAIGRFGGLRHGRARRLVVRGVALLAVLGTGVAWLRLDPAARRVAEPAFEAPVRDGRIAWAAFDPARIAFAHRRQRPVIVDFTADWCLNCKALERNVLETDAVRAALQRAGALPVQADWTNEDETIGRWLRKLGRSGLPAVALYLPDGSVDVLPEGFDAGALVQRIDRAAARFPADRFVPLAQACTVATAPAAHPAIARLTP